MSRSRPKRIAERVACALLVPAFGWCIYQSARLTRADSEYRANTPESLRQAVRLEPGNASYRQLLAEHLESAGGDSLHERETAAALSPHESRYWIDLGVAAEARSDDAAAERYYLKAASVDRTFAPRQALMNFYFRRHDEAAFRHWAHEALLMSYDDPSAIFRLCWLMTDDAESVRQLIPRNGPVARAYLQFLIENKHLEAARPVASELAQGTDADGVNFLLDYCSQAAPVQTASALEVWNTLSRRRLTPFSVLDPHTGSIVTNGDFREPPVEKGFDWAIARTDGVSVTFPNPGVEIELTGDQPQEIDILRQALALEPGAHYRLDYVYSGELDDREANRQPSGLAWVILGTSDPRPAARSADLSPVAHNAADHLEFTAPATFATLSLRYAREPGTIRHHEKFTIQSIASRKP